MAIEAEARVVLRGAGTARRELAGVSRARSEAATSAKKAAQDEKRAALDVERAKKRCEMEKLRAARATDRETKRMAKEQEREAKRALDYITEAHRRSIIERMKAEERLTKAAARESSRRLRDERRTLEKQKSDAESNGRRGRAFLGGVVGAAIGGAYGASRTARTIGGIRSMPERIQAANEFRERFTISASHAKLTAPEREQTLANINAAAAASGKDQNELVGVLETGQARFNDLRFFSDNLMQISKIARASGSDTAELAQALGYIKQAFGLSGDEAMEAADLMVAAASAGSIEVKDFARSFAPVAGLFAESLNLKGMGGVRQFLGVSQAAGTLGKSADETGTLVERFVAALADPQAAKDLKQSTGITMAGKTPQALIETLADSKKFNAPGVLQKVFRDVREQQAVRTLMASFRRKREGKDGAIDIGSIAGVTKEAGQDVTNRTMADLEGTGALAFDRQNAELQAHTLKNLTDYNAQLLKVNEMSMRLEMSFDKLALWSDAIAGTGIGGALGGMAAGGGGGGGLANGASLMGLGKSLGAIGGPLAILAGGAIAASAVYESGAGEGVGNWIADLFESDEVKRIKNGGKPAGDVKVTPNTPNTAQSGQQAAGATPRAAASPTQAQAAPTDPRLLRLMERQTALQEQIAANGKPAPFREPPRAAR